MPIGGYNCILQKEDFPARSAKLHHKNTFAKEQAAGQSDSLQFLIKATAQGQIPRALGQSYIFQTLVELIAKGQVLDASGQNSPLQAHIKVAIKRQGLETAGSLS